MKTEILQIGKSGISGRGLIALQDIPKGTFIGFVKGEVKHKVNHSEKDSSANPDWVGFKKNYWIDPLPPFKYINHACEPNCGISGTKKVYTIKNTKKGDELTIDYAITEIDPNWFLNCTCGSSKCRKKILSLQTLNKKTYQSYLPYIPTAFKKVYEAK